MQSNPPTPVLDEVLNLIQERNPKLGHRRTRRLLHCYYTSWNGRGPSGPVDSLYLDVF